MSPRPVVGILAAAGSGERLGTDQPKALVRCGGRPLYEWSLDALVEECDRVIVAMPPGFERLALDHERVTGTPGGAARSESVRNAATAAPEAAAYIVHDAARPLVTADLVERCLSELDRGWDAAVAATPMTDTVKEADSDRKVLRTLDRSALWSIQTPQAFRAAALKGALDAGPDRLADATDDASLVEAAGGRVRLVVAPPENVKVTTRPDLAMVEALLQHRREQGPC